MPPTLGAFRDWTRRYLGAASPGTRAALESEGVALATARRATMLDLIRTGPAQALADTVPMAVRQQLPAGVLAQLEQRVSGQGEVALGGILPAPGAQRVAPTSRRALIGEASFTAFTYGRRASQLTKLDTSLHGIALDGQLALHESPLRVLDPGEMPAMTPGAHCPVSRAAIEPPPPGTAANLGTLNIVEADGRIIELCTTTDDMVETLEQRLIAAESRPSPYVAAGAIETPTETIPAPDLAPNAWTTGPKKVLVIRVDFSDVPGGSVDAAEGQSVMDLVVKPFFENSSYGQTTLVTTVTPKLYRLPQTGASYATTYNLGGLHQDARKLAGADYDVASFDRVIVAFPDLGAGRIAKSQFTFSGWGDFAGAYIWINGQFTLRELAHELGHTYGLMHANLWEASDGNPVSASGRTWEYFDPFAVMGGGTTDARFDFDPWEKNLLGWMPDSAVLDVKSSGTYRVYRYDHPGAAALGQPLALRIFRDGLRWYWIGLRQNFAANASLSSGAYVIWGFANRQQSQLLDLGGSPLYTKPYAPDPTAALGLKVGTTFSDPDSGISIKAVGVGGNAPASYIDIAVTLPPGNRQSGLTAWGRDYTAFYDPTTGNLTAPVPETCVPANAGKVIAVTGGAAHALALRTDQTVVAWGNDASGQIAIPNDLGPVAGIAATRDTSGVVTTDGHVRIWGGAVNSLASRASVLSGVRQLALGQGSSGDAYALALKTDGTVVSWGNIGPYAGTLNQVVAVAAGNQEAYALKSDGTVVHWGVSYAGVPFPDDLSGVIAIAAPPSGYHGLALKADGTVVAWGNNTYGQATPPAGLHDVIAIAAGDYHSLALKSDGTVVGWGYDVNGETNVPGGLPGVSVIGAGAASSFAAFGATLYFTKNPASQTVPPGQSVSFTAQAAGSDALTYQWRLNGAAIAGATSPTLTLAAVAAGNSGMYDVVTSDGTRSVVSAGALLTVATPATIPDPPVTQPTVPTNPPVALTPARLVNLSVLTSLQTPGDSFMVGYVVAGPDPANNDVLLLRAVGPSLGVAPFNLPGVLADPRINFFQNSLNSGTVASWNGNPEYIRAFAQVGAFPLNSPAYLDAVTLHASAPAVYALQIMSATRNTGQVLAEIYEANPAGVATPTSHLVNLSVLKNVGASLTAGFVIGGEAPMKVLVRAVGPTLANAPFNVTGTMADPKIEVFDNTGKSIGKNDNWGGGADLATVFSNVGAFALPANSKDAAIVLTLAPGAYTAVVTPASGATGTAIVEVYVAP